MMELDQLYHEHVDELGRSALIRRYVVGMLLTTRFHLASRPISSANDGFFHRLARSCDALLSVLRSHGWSELSPQVEAGIGELRPLLAWPAWQHRRNQMMVEFKSEFRRWFRELNLPWSCLAPVAFSLSAWPEPRVVSLNVGLNIGIGDELLLFELSERLAIKYPHAELRVSSFNRCLWDLCPHVHSRRYFVDDQLAPLCDARRSIANDSDTLLLFAEFASAPMYRHLESISSIPRFVYIDTGGRCVRLVDQRTRSINELEISPKGGIYDVLDRLLAHAGLERALKAANPVRQALTTSRQRSVFVNPFSSKRFDELSPEWWAEALATAHAQVSLEARIFPGINDVSRAYVAKILARCRVDGTPARQFAHETVESIANTLLLARECDLVFGLDTFTAHIGVLYPTPCVTVYFGSEWDLWKVRNNHALNAYVQDSSEAVGHLIARLLADVDETIRERAAAIVQETEAFQSVIEVATTDSALRVFRTIRELVRSWIAIDPTIAETFVDVPPSYFVSLCRALRRARICGAPDERRIAAMIDRAVLLWTDGNLYRYAKFAAEAPVHP